MKYTLGCLRKADNDFGLIESGDGLMIALSGGKDSLLLVKALSMYRLFSKKEYTLSAMTLDLGIGEACYDAVGAFCAEHGVAHTVIKTGIARVVFEDMKEKNPCALCAKMRRGIINEKAAESGCNKVALGHHRDDILETLLLNIIYESRLAVFKPKTYLSRTGVTVIRPLAYLPEAHISKVSRRLALPVLENPCPACGETSRAEVKDLIRQLKKQYSGFDSMLFGALKNADKYDLWDKAAE